MIINIQELSESCYIMCKKNDWDRGWLQVGCYLHLESSEFIEALRGKGDIVNEAGDVLFVLLSTLAAHQISLEEVINSMNQKMKSMEYYKEKAAMKT